MKPGERDDHGDALVHQPAPPFSSESLILRAQPEMRSASSRVRYALGQEDKDLAERQVQKIDRPPSTGLTSVQS